MNHYTHAARYDAIRALLRANRHNAIPSKDASVIRVLLYDLIVPHVEEEELGGTRTLTAEEAVTLRRNLLEISRRLKADPALGNPTVNAFANRLLSGFYCHSLLGSTATHSEEVKS